MWQLFNGIGTLANYDGTYSTPTHRDRPTLCYNKEGNCCNYRYLSLLPLERAFMGGWRKKKEREGVEYEPPFYLLVFHVCLVKVIVDHVYTAIQLLNITWRIAA